MRAIGVAGIVLCAAATERMLAQPDLHFGRLRVD